MTEQEDGTYRQDRYTNILPNAIANTNDDPRVVEQARKKSAISASYNKGAAPGQKGPKYQLTPAEQEAYQADINQQAEQSNRESLAAGQKPVWKVDKDGNYYLLANPNKEDWEYETYSTNDNARG